MAVTSRLVTENQLCWGKVVRDMPGHGGGGSAFMSRAECTRTGVGSFSCLRLLDAASAGWALLGQRSRVLC